MLYPESNEPYMVNILCSVSFRQICVWVLWDLLVDRPSIKIHYLLSTHSRSVCKLKRVSFRMLSIWIDNISADNRGQREQFSFSFMICVCSQEEGWFSIFFTIVFVRQLIVH